MSDVFLALRARDGEREAFRQLLEQNYDRIYRVAYRFCGNADNAEDIAQDICIGLVGKLASFKGEARFSSWLYRVTLNACRDHARRQASIRSLHEAYGEVSALIEAAGRDTARQAAWVHEALASLDQALRETALLVVSEELSHAEAAEILGVKEATVSWRMHEVRKKLRSLLGTYHDE
jgi:RNA polymerase sigma-70 factor (ECF subfamily)